GGGIIVLFKIAGEPVLSFMVPLKMLLEIKGDPSLMIRLTKSLPLKHLVPETVLLEIKGDPPVTSIVPACNPQGVIRLSANNTEPPIRTSLPMLLSVTIDDPSTTSVRAPLM